MPKLPKKLKKQKAAVARRIRKYPDKEIIRRIFKYVFPYKRTIYFLMFLLLVSSLINLAYPFGVMLIINQLGDPNFTFLVGIGVALVGIMIVLFFTRKNYNYRVSILGIQAMNDIRRDLFGHLQVLSFQYYIDRSPGKIMSTLTNDVGAVNNLISNAVIQFIGDIITVIGTMIALVYLSFVLTLVILGVLALGIPIFWFFAKKSRTYYRQTQRTVSDLTKQLQEGIVGSRTIKAFVTEEENIETFQKMNRQNLEANLSAAKLNAALQPVVQFLAAIALGIVLYVGTQLIVSGQLTIAGLVAYFLLAQGFVGPFGNVTSFYQTTQLALAAGERILDLLDTPPDVVEKEDAYDLPPIEEGVVEFEHVSFEYEKDVPVLKDINLKTRARQRVALVGFTGAGKTTLISLLMRFYDPQIGKISIDGHDLRDVTLKSLHQQLGIVPQDTFLFTGTIKDNIRYGKLDATDEEVQSAAKIVGAHEFIMKLENGYDTAVTEEGKSLSIGQRQLLAFTRAILRDPPLLILDEATSSVDPYSELLIQEALEKLLQDRTSFSIAHRLSTVVNSDLIMVMDDGKIVESGTHDELVKIEGGLYKRLFEMQFKDSAKPTAS
ncbi:MAG: ABC transporter ATP-binding protein [Promethearchaeota archaeon]